MSRIIDARKLTCPQPVMLTLKALEETDEVTTIVDNEPARENVAQLGKSQGCEVGIERKKEGIYLTLKKKKATPVKNAPQTAAGVVLFIASEFLGRGEDAALGSLLMQKFLHTIEGLVVRPETVILVNSGVKLCAADSSASEELRMLESHGIEVLACGTCLTKLNLMDRISAGRVSDMYTIADKLLRAKKIVSL
ncbi:MAG: sulfurtransferase-like selenium metabolism protein YedF [Dehalococcoidales bacterium]|nr:sulfurtransferase-like selenium metabolism protein YedF [Dehalococcoidales bacterium]